MSDIAKEIKEALSLASQDFDKGAYDHACAKIEEHALAWLSHQQQLIDQLQEDLRVQRRLTEREKHYADSLQQDIEQNKLLIDQQTEQIANYRRHANEFIYGESEEGYTYIESLKAEIKRLEEDKSSFMSNCLVAVAKITVLKRDNDMLEETVSEQAKEIERLNYDNELIQSEWDAWRNENWKLKEKIKELREVIREAKDMEWKLAGESTPLFMILHLALIEDDEEGVPMLTREQIAVKALERVQTYPRGEALVYVTEIKSIAEVALEEIKRISAEGEQP